MQHWTEMVDVLEIFVSVRKKAFENVDKGIYYYSSKDFQYIYQ